MNAKEARALTDAVKPKKPADDLFDQIRERAALGLDYIRLTNASGITINPEEVYWLTDNGYTVNCAAHSPFVTISW
ncbi:MAG: hypothetical protein NVS3B25_19140 [Hymenobacter sp.]